MQIKNQSQLKKKKARQKKTDEIQKPLRVKLNKNDLELLTQDVNNLNNNEFKTTVNKKAYDLKIAKKFLLEMTIQKISEKEALELYFDLIISDTTALKN